MHSYVLYYNCLTGIISSSASAVAEAPPEALAFFLDFTCKFTWVVRVISLINQLTPVSSGSSESSINSRERPFLLDIFFEIADLTNLARITLYPVPRAGPRPALLYPLAMGWARGVASNWRAPRIEVTLNS